MLLTLQICQILLRINIIILFSDREIFRFDRLTQTGIVIFREAKNLLSIKRDISLFLRYTLDAAHLDNGGLFVSPLKSNYFYL